MARCTSSIPTRRRWTHASTAPNRNRECLRTTRALDLLERGSGLLPRQTFVQGSQLLNRFTGLVRHPIAFTVRSLRPMLSWFVAVVHLMSLSFSGNALPVNRLCRHRPRQVHAERATSALRAPALVRGPGIITAR